MFEVYIWEIWYIMVIGNRQGQRKIVISGFLYEGYDEVFCEYQEI